MLAGTVRQDCQPPVLAMAKLPIGALEGLASRTSTSPLTPPAAPEATRATNCVAAVLPKSIPRYCAQSPLPICIRFWPPPVSVVVSRPIPDCWLYASACRVLYADE